MTEAIYLALIALGETIVLGLIGSIVFSMIIKRKPSHFKITWSKHGTTEASFNTKADE